MKVLFATSQGADYLSSVLWDGLQELLGQENVYSVWDVQNFRRHMQGNLPFIGDPCARISNTRSQRVLADQGDFDLLVLVSCFLRERDWHWPWQFLPRLRESGKVAYVEPWDSTDEVHDPYQESCPSFRVDKVFRREIDPGRNYPYECHSLMMAAPARWLYVSDERPLDVFYAGHALGYERRWEVMAPVFSTSTRHRSTVLSHGALRDEYFPLMRMHKLGLAPPGSAVCGDCLRTWELAASGVIPIFVGYPPRYREPWWGDDEVLTLGRVEEIAGLIDRALMTDLRPMRERMQARFYAEHTTYARAKRMLDIMGF